MARGFQVSKQIDRSAPEVWGFLTDFDNAQAWMTGIEEMRKVTSGPLSEGTRYFYRARGKERETSVSKLDPGKKIALTSIQRGITATYFYSVRPDGDGAEVSLDARCQASGLWRLIHPLIAAAMKRVDSDQFDRLAAALENRPKRGF